MTGSEYRTQVIDNIGEKSANMKLGQGMNKISQEVCKLDWQAWKNEKGSVQKWVGKMGMKQRSG